MPQKTIAGTTVDVNDEGYLTNQTQWTREVAAELAKEEGIAVLSEGHWKVIDYLRKYVTENGSAPTIRRLTTAGGVQTKELYELFPGGPLKKACKIAGLMKPVGCI